MTGPEAKLRLGARAALAAVVALAAFSLPFALRRGIDSDLASLLAGERGELLREVSCGAAAGATLLVSASSGEEAAAAAARLAEELSIPVAGPKGAIAELAAHGAGLLSAHARRAIAEGRSGEVCDAAVARLFAPGPRFAPLSADPMMLVQDFAAESAPAALGAWQDVRGIPIARVGSRHVAALRMRSDSRARDEWHRLAERFRAEAEKGAPVRVDLAGAVFHTALAEASSKREMNFLSVFSLGFALALGFALFRSWRFLPVLAAGQLCAFTVATAALFAYAGRPHAVTFVFGTSLIGLSVDYIYHALAARRPVARELTLSMLTTVACFAPLALAPASTLRQMAVFTVSGIATVWAFAVLLPHRAGSPAFAPSPAPRAAPGGGVVLALALAIAAASAFAGMKISSEPSAFHRPDPYLAAGERLLAELNGASGELAYVRAGSIQAALEREEELGIRGVSALIPSLRRQRENRALKERLYRENGDKYEKATGVKLPDRVEGPELDAEKLDSPALAALVEAAWTGRGLLSPANGGPVPEGALAISPRRMLEEMFLKFTADLRLIAGWSLAAAAAMLALVFRRRPAVGIAPLAAGIAGAAGATLACGVKPTAFTLIAMLILAGLGADYTLFNALGLGDERTRKTVFFSFLTSFAGLGALAFTDFEVTRSMGVAFAGGLPAAYFVSTRWRAPRDRNDRETLRHPCGRG